MQEGPGHIYRKPPQVGQLLDRPEFAARQLDYPRRFIAESVRSVLDGLRKDVRAGRAISPQRHADLTLGAPRFLKQPFITSQTLAKPV
jgi:hypothetical protein